MNTLLPALPAPGPRLDAAQDLADAFAGLIAHLHVDGGGAPGDVELVRMAACAASSAASAGHACARLGDVGLTGMGGAPHWVDSLRRSPHGYDWPSPARWRAALRASPVVAFDGSIHALAGAELADDGHDLAPDRAAETFRPLALDGAGRLYLHRYWDYEVRLAQRLAALNRPWPLSEADLASATRLLAQLFPAAAGAALLSQPQQKPGVSLQGQPQLAPDPRPDPRPEPDLQKVAAAVAVARRLCIISGGPGTGKTTTVVKVLAVLLTLQPALRIALAAPTGKAAARLQESIRLQAQTLPVAAPILARMPQASHTLHRLLGYRPGRVQFRHDRQHPLPYDVVVVDEASMLDLALAAKLFDAVSDTARVILLGDKDQLTSVETGSVFADLCRRRSVTRTAAERVQVLTGYGSVPGSAADGAGAAGDSDAADSTDTTDTAAVAAGTDRLADAVVWLERSYRFSSAGGIGRLAAQVNRGNAQAALLSLRAAAVDLGGAVLSWDEDPLEVAELAGRLIHGYADFVAAVRLRKPAREVLAAFDRYRVLCALNDGPQGTRRLNEALAARCRLALGESAAALSGLSTRSASHWFHGRPVLVGANDYALGLYNGDIGVALVDRRGRLAVNFPRPDGAIRSLSPAQLGGCDSAFAMTIHKAQGSEFERIAVVLPATDNPVLTRELLYTALTRARRSLRLWAPADILATTIGRRIEHYSGLADRLGKA